MSTFAGRTVLVTGASSGIGRATALLLARQGCAVVLLSRSESALEEVRRECERAGGRALVAVADVGDPVSVQAAFRAARDTFGPVRGVVHSAAVMAYGRFEDVPADVFDAAVRTTLGGTAVVARCALAAFRDAGGGSLVVIGSLLGKMATPYMSSYVTAKWGVHGLVRTLQVEARSAPKIRISLVWPGGVDTPVYAQAGTYLGRHGRPPLPVDPPEKVARAAVRALSRPRRESSVGVANHVLVLGFRAIPAVFDRLVTPLMRVGGLSREQVPNSTGNVFTAVPEGEAVHGGWRRRRPRWTGRTPEQPTAGTVASPAAVASGPTLDSIGER
jgi:NAD(P)-dependent dehydrogenase (short-subunit alcohol dehydrogenase family)